ncbi:winged helix-turn-helix domain-containing protein [Serratia sp. PL7]|uniref:winged helix-turn-helix domain-containing protein n=3 Tax=unclassified Serratia (in: enterobacteria) TaxID=2647522 RepID=UPI0021AE2D00|nr:winged helix-turn-helix domain-containing protein [Serratia sp. PL7]
MEYIFNDSVIFKENEGLRYKNQSHAAIKLSVLQSGLLAEIIKAQSEPIHRDVLLDRVWERNSYPPSNSSLNHNVAFLRKSLKELGINDAIIAVHRLGFKLGGVVDVKVCQPVATLLRDEEKDVYISNNEIINIPQRELPLYKRWQHVWHVGVENKRTLFICVLLLLGLLSVMSVFYWPTPTNEVRHYVAKVAGCRTYSVYALDDDQKDKYRHYAEYFLQSQSKRCAPDDILLMYVQDEHGLRETLEGNNRAFFSICNFDKKITDFCYNYYFYSMVPK